ncbi:methylated-DNA-protein-cysteine methyltransferase related protein [Thalassobacillus cyri]|uniref:Methylated-DNA-protein-cysteine methyltransferase related protein n=1 Tax=Thalassobacillus cyri TaxID=571932 RepID=A0A1H3XE54_9BACI|nr:MGMT family protein [Thalassobacillus cyri]SDZ97231.1 methylated-DNA-protein-cysteine methyltransferase related protein [Thalassobacillus cyri]
MEIFTKKVIHLISTIPEGNVMTYGQIAKLAGSPRGARQVARILHTMSRKYKLPWHRVVSAKGQIAIKDEETAEEQRIRLESEEVRIENGRYINLIVYQYHPQV